VTLLGLGFIGEGVS